MVLGGFGWFWKVLGGSICRVLRVGKAGGGSICRIEYAARRPADPVNPCPCFILRRFLPRAFYQEICFFARPKGALRLSARLIPNGLSYPESVTLSRNDDLIPKRLSYPESIIFSASTVARQ